LSGLIDNKIDVKLDDKLDDEVVGAALWEDSAIDDDVEEDLIDDDPVAKAQLVAQAADSLKAEQIVALDLRGLTIIADFFVICTGNSSIQIRSITDRIEDRMRDHGFRKLRKEGYQEATWILLDYGDVVVHIMAAEQREFYQLEAFWSEAPRLELELQNPAMGLNERRSDY
jgi:ribosome-associated protein